MKEWTREWIKLIERNHWVGGGGGGGGGGQGDSIYRFLGNY